MSKLVACGSVRLQIVRLAAVQLVVDNTGVLVQVGGRRRIDRARAGMMDQ